jgi:hypothetical protein
LSKNMEPNLTIFFKCFLNAPERLDADLGFSASSLKRVRFVRRKPQIAVHVEAPCQAHDEKALEKDCQIRFLKRAI